MKVSVVHPKAEVAPYYVALPHERGVYFVLVIVIQPCLFLFDRALTACPQLNPPFSPYTNRPGVGHLHSTFRLPSENAHLRHVLSPSHLPSAVCWHGLRLESHHLFPQICKFFKPRTNMTGGAGHSRQTGNSKPNHHRDRASRRSGSRDVVDTLSQPAKQNENASRPAFTLPSAILMTLSLDLTQNQTKYQQGHDSVEDTAFSRIGQAEADWYPLRSAPWADARLPALSHGTPTRVTTTAAAADDDDNDDSTASMSASVGSVSPPSQ